MQTTVVFWFVCVLLVIGTLGVLLRALLGRRAPAAPADATASVAIFRDQKRQLDDDLANGVIDADEHARLADELARRLGHEVADADAGLAAPQTGAAATRTPWKVAAAIAILVPVGAGAIYFALGRPAAVALPDIAAKRPMTQADVMAMIDTLARRMKDNPADPAGWALLGRSYAALGRYDDALRAFAEAAKRAPGDADLLADYADVVAMGQGSLKGQPDELVARALAIDPRNPKALALAASSATERHDYDAALAQWRKLATLLPPGSDNAREVAQAIADVEQRRAAGAATANAGTDATATAPGTAAKAPAGATSGTAVSGDVSLSPSLASHAVPGDTVFVFARAVDGPRMPLAVMRTTVGALPLAFSLDDSMAMAPGATISSAHEVVVEARVSRSGNATPAAGDLIGKSAPSRPGATNIHVVIDTVNR